MSKKSYLKGQRHPSHVTRISIDASTYDEICINCGATDIAGGGWGVLAKPCPKVPPKNNTTKEVAHDRQD